MTLNELMELANDGYPDDQISACWDPVLQDITDYTGDTLATFIVIELKETFDPEQEDLEQRAVALNALNRAIDEIQSVMDSIS